MDCLLVLTSFRREMVHVQLVICLSSDAVCLALLVSLHHTQASKPKSTRQCTYLQAIKKISGLLLSGVSPSFSGHSHGY